MSGLETVSLVIEKVDWSGLDMMNVDNADLVKHYDYRGKWWKYHT